MPYPVEDGEEGVLPLTADKSARCVLHHGRDETLSLEAIICEPTAVRQPLLVDVLQQGQVHLDTATKLTHCRPTTLIGVMELTTQKQQGLSSVRQHAYHIARQPKFYTSYPEDCNQRRARRRNFIDIIKD